jgi:hypothetical protein
MGGPLEIFMCGISKREARYASGMVLNGSKWRRSCVGVVADGIGAVAMLELMG